MVDSATKFLLIRLVNNRDSLLRSE